MIPDACIPLFVRRAYRPPRPFAPTIDKRRRVGGGLSGAYAGVHQVERSSVGSTARRLVIEAHALAEPDGVDAPANQIGVEGAKAIGGGEVHALGLHGEGGDHGNRCCKHAIATSIRHCWAQRPVYAHTRLGELMPNALPACTVHSHRPIRKFRSASPVIP